MAIVFTFGIPEKCKKTEVKRKQLLEGPDNMKEQ
jgi:hypothetical protein